MDLQEDHPCQLFIYHENNIPESFPSLNSVYKRDIFGTPVPFKTTIGQDGPTYRKIKAQSITFMKEYQTKSFDELRFEDYQSNRTLGIEWFQEKNYLKRLSPELWKPLPSPSPTTVKTQTTKVVKISRSFDSVTAKDEPGSNKNHGALNTTSSLSKLNSAEDDDDDDDDEDINTSLRPTKERSSFLTNVDKQNIIEPDIQLPLNFKEEPPTRYTSCKYSTQRLAADDYHLNDTTLLPNKTLMVSQNLERYFQRYITDASFPSDFFSTMPHNFRVCCEDPRLAYNYHTRAKEVPKSHMETLLELLQGNKNGHSYYNTNYEKIPSNSKGCYYYSIHAKLYDTFMKQQQIAEYRKMLVPKYKVVGGDGVSCFNMDYFWSKIDPYSRRTRHLGRRLRSQQQRKNEEVQERRTETIWK